MESTVGCHFVNYSLHLDMLSIEEEIGRRIRQARRSRVPDMSIEKLAEESGLSRQTVSAIENGRRKKVSFSVIAQLMRALGMELDFSTLAETVAEPPHLEYGKKNPRKGSGKSTSEMVSRRRLKRAG